MAFVHGLVRTRANRGWGWCAPLELGEAAPHYVSYVVPVDDRRDFLSEYVCEVVTAAGGYKARGRYELIRRGIDSFLLSLDGREVWFTARPVPKEDRFAPYVGKLRHEDFQHLFTEIEPAEPEVIDRLYDESGAFIVGCDPFAHYKRTADVPTGRRRST